MKDTDKKDTPQIVKKYSLEETRNIVINYLKSPSDLESTLLELGNNIFPKYINGNENDKKLLNDEYIENSLRAMIGLETETHTGLMETVDEKYRALAKELPIQFIKDYGCTTSVEKALAELAANAFIRVIDNSRRLNNELNGTSITTNRNHYISIVSKQVDRANRQFISTIFALKQLKVPTIELNIKANTAFVAQNQQVNVDKNNEAK